MSRTRSHRVAPSASLLLAVLALAVALRAVASDFVPVPRFTGYVVEVCAGCGWNHLVRSYLL